GGTLRLAHYFVDDNQNPLGWWTQKHNGYAIREAIDLLNIEYNFLPVSTLDDTTDTLAKDAAEKRAKKLRYARMPLFWRSFIYFLYRYILKLGFTEGKEGFLWHFLQGWWYRTLVDAKIYEVKKACGSNPAQMKAYIQEKYGVRL
ncbi:hypothetical protein U9S71_06790, partial [Parapedobacter sp. 10938]|nr:hypothetical protein [Parapedobacter sp. 10938]